MSKWLKTTSFTAPLSDTNNDKINKAAAYSSFVQHWQHTLKIFNSSKKFKVTCDEVTAVINHFGQMINLLVVDLHQLRDVSFLESRIEDNILQLKENGSNSPNARIAIDAPPTPIYDLLLGERILEAILKWSINTGEYMHTMQLELLKNYETILNNSHPEILIFKPITQPLQSLLQMCSGCVPVEVEKRLVVLLNHLWVSLLYNRKLLNYFYFPKENDPAKQIVIFSLLLPFAHREGGIGQQARDALLLCMSLSASNSTIAEYIALNSNFCPILAAGLSGLYSMLPRTLQGRHASFRIAPSDVSSSAPLQMFMNSLEFCNAVIQTAHPLVQDRLVDLLYQGFLRPVIGPALSQCVTEELVTAIVYLELFLHTTTENKLQRAFLALILLPQVFCDLSIITNLISQLRSGSTQLTLVVTNLLNTIISMRNEDAMITLVFQFLSPCSHIMLSQIAKLLMPTMPSSSAHFVHLVPNVCQQTLEEHLIPECQGILNYPQCIKRRSNPGRSSSLEYKSSNHSDDSNSTVQHKGDSKSMSPFCDYLSDSQVRIASTSFSCSSWNWKFNGKNPSPRESAHLLSTNQLISTSSLSFNANHEKLHQSLPPYCNARPLLSTSVVASVSNLKRRTMSLPIILPSRGQTIDREQLPNNDCLEIYPETSSSSFRQRLVQSWYTLVYDENCHDSIDESSGYESFTLKEKKFSPNGSLSEEEVLAKDDEFFQFLDECATPPPSDDDHLYLIDEAYILIHSQNLHLNAHQNVQSCKEKLKFNGVRISSSMSSFDDILSQKRKDNCLLTSSSRPTIGPLLESLLHLVDNFLLLNVDTIILVMSCITELASYPCSLLNTLILQPSIVLQPSIRSLYQVLGQLKQKIDILLSSEDLSLLLDARERLNNWIPEPDKCSIRSQTPNSGKGGGDKRSFSQTVSAFFKRGFPDRNSGRESLQNLPDGAGYRYFNTHKSSSYSSQQQSDSFFSASPEKQHAALCSVLLQDWLLELSALTYEHSVASPPMIFSSLNLKTNI